MPTHRPPNPQRVEETRRLLKEFRALPLSERKILAEKLMGKKPEPEKK